MLECVIANALTHCCRSGELRMILGNSRYPAPYSRQGGHPEPFPDTTSLAVCNDDVISAAAHSYSQTESYTLVASSDRMSATSKLPESIKALCG